MNQMALSPAQAVIRLMSPGLDAALQQFANAEVLAAGKVNVIALDTVMDRFGERWPARRDQVHEHVHALLGRQLGAHGYHLRISDTDILVCQPHLGRLSGQASCFRLLRDILTHFLGAGEQAKIGVHEVLSISQGGVQARRVDAAAVAEEDPAKPRGRVPSEEAPGAAPVDCWTPFVASDGRRLDVSCRLDEVRELRLGKVIGLRLAGSVTDDETGCEFGPSELDTLSRSDRLRIDLGRIAKGLALLQARDSGPEPLALIVPASFSSLSNFDGRARIVSAFRTARAYAAQGVICELCDLEGVPPTSLIPVAATIRPFSLFVIGQVAGLTRSEASTIREAALRGVAIECPRGMADATFAGWARERLPPCKRAANSVLLYGVPSEPAARIGRALGASHATILSP